MARACERPPRYEAVPSVIPPAPPTNSPHEYDRPEHYGQADEDLRRMLRPGKPPDAAADMLASDADHPKNRGPELPDPHEPATDND